MNTQILELLKNRDILLEPGLTTDEFDQIQNIYDVEFPAPLHDFLGSILPVSKGFYNWRNFSKHNVEFIKACMQFPVEYICNQTNEVDWNEEWGIEPTNEEVRDDEIRKRALNAPKLIPIYLHRYMPLGHFNRYPIISIHGIDVIYYGKDINDYIRNEFGNGNRAGYDYETIQKVPFWTDLM